MGWGTASPCPPLHASSLPPGGISAGRFPLPQLCPCEWCWEAAPKSSRALGPAVLPSLGSRCAGQGHWFLSQPRPRMSCISLAGPWAAGSKQGGDSVLGKSQLQAWPAKVMLFPDVPQPILPSVHCSTAKVGGELGWSCLCGHTSRPLDFSPTPFLHPWPPLAFTHLQPTANINAVLPFFCTLPQSILQAL